MEKRIQRRGFRKVMCLVVLILLTGKLFAQSPYSISPKWYFGKQGGMSFPAVGAPSPLLGGKVDGLAQEASSTMCDPSGNVIFYTDSYRLYDGNNNFVQFINGGTSSTNSSVCFPDPANPTTEFYLVTANEDFGGGGSHGATPATSGIFWYKIQKTGPGSISVLAGPNQLATNTEVTEQLCSGSDGNGGYWVVAHQGGGSNGNQLWSWNFTSTGVGAKQISSVAGTDAATTYQGSLKINKCQTRLAAVFWSGKVEVYNWDKLTGKVTSLYRSYTLPSAFVYGCEFSPDGNMLYFTSMVGNQLYQYDLTSNSVIALGSGSSNNITEMGTLQIGPDDKIYVTNVSNYAQPAYIGVVNNPNVSGTSCNYSSTGFVLNNSVGNWPNIYRGIANEAWINPDHTISNSGACETIAFGYNFKTYFGSNISIVAGSEEWDFGDGAGFQTGLGATPSHTYANGGNFTVRMKVTDNTCNTVWTTTKTITVTDCGCPNDAVAPTSINPVNPICSNVGGNIVLHANGGSGTQLEWYIGSCGTANTGTLGNDFSTPAPTVTTTYFVRWLSDGICANSSCISITVTVKDVPAIPLSIASSRDNFCSNDAGTIVLSASSGANSDSLVWYTGSCGGTRIGVGNSLPQIQSPTVTTTYYVRGENGVCPPSCGSITVNVITPPTPTINGTLSSCANTSGLVFSTTDNSGSGNTYLWSASGGLTITTSNTLPSITASISSSAGSVTVTETAGNCSTTVSQNISIIAATSQATAGANRSICDNSFTLNGNTPLNGSGTWTIASGSGTFSPDANDPAATVSNLGNGLNEFVWTITGTCGITDDTVSITTGSNNLSINAITNNEVACFGTPKNIQVVTSNGSGFYTYQWTSSDNSFIATTNSPNVSVIPSAVSTVYYLKIIDNKNTGCDALDTVTIEALADQELVIPNLITPNGDDKNDFLEIKDKNELQLLPGASLEILNRWGDRIYDNSDYNNTWNAPNVSDGVYYYLLKSGCGNRVYKGWLQIIH